MSRELKNGPMVGTRPYRIWQGMKARCNKKEHKFYYRYGGRGIKYDPAWEKFSIFWRDMKKGYAENLTLDRRDNNKGYSKENCRWANQFEQMNNAVSNRNITHKGKTQSLSMWAREIGVTKNTLWDRLKKRSIKESLTMPIYGRFITFNGRTQNMTDWAKEIKMSKNTLYDRLDAGWTIRRALTQPIKKQKNNAKV